MIYESVDSADNIEQGDIFRNIPRIDVSLNRLLVVDDQGEASEMDWNDVLEKNKSDPGTTAIATIQPVDAIVITQNCDAVRSEFISLCQIDNFKAVTGKSPANAKNWQAEIVTQSRRNTNFFYLPENNEFGLDEKMAVNFKVVLRIRRTDLESIRDNRLGKLNDVANEHFRETIAQFFRRYPYNEWYPLNAEEFKIYSDKSPETIEPYPHQTDS